MNKDTSVDNEYSEPEYKRLSRVEALEIFSEKELMPRVNSPWQIVKLQCVLTFAFTIIAILWSFYFYTKGLVLSVVLGGALGVIPSSVFIIRASAVKKSNLVSAKRFISSWVYAEVIKITLTLTIIIFVIRLFPNLHWLSFLGMYLVTLQSYWLIGFIKIKNK
jgi:F0F1-type ATP synthase assembly protein I